jgi:hypothetical protein
MLTCKTVIELLVDYLESTLTDEVCAALELHLRDCAPCVAYLNTYRKTRDLAAAEGRVEMPEEMRRRLRAVLLEHLQGPPADG